MRRTLAIAALLVVALAGTGCGKYGKPMRTATRPPAAGVGAQPAAQPGAAAPTSAPTPDGEACEEEPKAETPAP